MSSRSIVQPGIERLLARHTDWLQGKRVALLSHPAAIDVNGTASADRLHHYCGSRLVALLGPEHGYFGHFAAGAPVRSRRHPDLGIPIHSLYGKSPRPSSAMLRNIDVIVVDLQDLAVRCYTYVSTLRHVIEAAAEYDKVVIVADRPVPFAGTVDGPTTTSGFDSMVAHIHTPMVYGMTPGESAGWIAAHYGHHLDLRIARISGYQRSDERPHYASSWIPPSPGIASWETAWCYPMTVFTEAVPAVDCGRGTRLPFQVFGAPWLKGAEVAEQLNAMKLPGLQFHAHLFAATGARYKDQLLNGVRIAITRPARIRPVATSLAIIACLQQRHGRRRIWSQDARPDFFDALYGTDQVRIALQDGASHDSIANAWEPDIRRFRRTRAPWLLYP